MSSKKRVNKTFEESCRIENLFIDQNNGTHWCISKESPKSRKFDKTVCQLLSCPNYISKEIESLSKKEKKIRGYIEKGKSIEFIMEKTPCSRAWYFRVKKRMEDDNEKRLKKEQNELDEKSKASKKIEHIEEPVKSIHINEKALSVSIEKTRVQARNRVYPQKNKLKPLEIKLNLNEFTNFKNAIRHALDNSYRWTKYNIKEIREYISEIEKNLNPSPYYLENAKTYQGYPTPVTYYGFVTKKEAHRLLGISYHYPDWMKYLEKLVNLWELSRTSALRKEYLTTKEWYERMEIDFPQSLEQEANMVITNRKDLVRSGIFGDLEYELKGSLKIDDELEHAYHNWNDLDSYEKTEVHHRLLTHRDLKNHPYYISIMENIKHDKTENFR